MVVEIGQGEKLRERHVQIPSLPFLIGLVIVFKILVFLSMFIQPR